jgi:hypothetical protein
MSEIYILKLSEESITGVFQAYRIANLGDFNWDVRTPVSPMPLPEENHEENILVKMEGNSASGNVSWKIMEDENNFGTYDTRAKVDGSTNANYNKFIVDSDIDSTSAAQLRKWRDEFVPTSVKDRFRIIVQSGTTHDLIDDGTLGGIQFRIDSSSPVVWTASLSFFVGTVYTIFEADVPERPSKVEITGGSGVINVSWTTSTSYADSSDAPTITGTSVKYKKDGGIWTEANNGTNQYAVGHGGEDSPPSASQTTSYQITSLTSGNYRVKVANLSADSHTGLVKYYRNGLTSNDGIFVQVT